MERAGSATEREPRALRQLRELTRWAADGRPLTQTGRIRLADARELVSLLGTRDAVEGRFPTTSSAQLQELTLIVEWAKACGLVRVVRGRLVSVKKRAGLLDDEAALWDRMFDAFGSLGTALCPDGWTQSFMRDEFRHVIAGVLWVAHHRGPSFPLSEACALAWQLATLRYILDTATTPQLSTWRAMNDRDLRCALAVLEELGAVRLAGGTVALTDRGAGAVLRVTGGFASGAAALSAVVAAR